MGDTWAPREGAYGRTRDGRRVGPIEANDPEDYPWRVPTGSHPDHPFINWPANGRGVVFGSRLMPADSGWDLVAEWIDSPVRTVTRREIVPGRYGLVTVDPSGAYVRLGLVRELFTADELDAAAAVLTQLAEALRNG